MTTIDFHSFFSKQGHYLFKYVKVNFYCEYIVMQVKRDREKLFPKIKISSVGYTVIPDITQLYIASIFKTNFTLS